MAYRRPGIELTQEFQGLVAALAAFSLPNCNIGPAFKVYVDDELGTYTGISTAYAYASQMPGTLIDVAPLSPLKLADDQFPVVAKLTNVVLEVVAQRDSGVASDLDLTLFTDASVDAFADVSAGDTLKVMAADAFVVPARADGVVADTAPNTLVSPVAGLFVDAEPGDKVVISAFSGGVAGTYYVQAKTDDQTLVLSGNFFSGSGSVTAVPYAVQRETGADNQGTYLVRTKIDNNTLKLATELVKGESFLVYTIDKAGEDQTLVRDTDYSVSGTAVTLDAGLMQAGLPVVLATVTADYRALRGDLAAQIREFKSLADLESVFGVGQVVPANPLAFALSLCLQNAVTPTKGLGLATGYFTDETQAYLRALDVIKRSTDYAFLPLTNNPQVHSMFSAHVTQMSAKERGKWRVAFINRTLITTETMVDTKTTSGFRTIVNTQTDGIVTLGDNKLSLSIPKFGNVQRGDIVVVVGGTGVVVGEYPVTAKNTNNMELTLGGSFLPTYSSGNVEFYVKRPDGLEANGMVFFDSTASFIADGVAPGQHLVIESGAAAGNWLVTSVDAENKLRVEQVPGIVSVQGAQTYHIFRDLDRTEQATTIKAYTESFRNRRLVHVWPDVAQIQVGATVMRLPGYYLACAPLALTTGLPSQQGFTNMSVSGFFGVEHSNDYFDDDQLDILADGGSMIFTQEVEGAPLMIRHELTTDRTAIKFQEYMITKNVDMISKVIVGRQKKYIGTWNVYDGLFADIGKEATAIITYLKEKTSVPQLGGMIREGSLEYVREGVTIDTVEERWNLRIPAPLNNIDVTLVV